mgnify:CR=1 FL=1
MLATGRGEVLTRLPSFPRLSVVLAKPPVGVSTAWAYKTYDAGYDGPHPDNEAMLEAIHGGDAHKAAGLLCNVLEGVTVPMHPEISRIKEMMEEKGALAAMMSGSGPTVFGIFSEEEKAYEAKAQIRASGIARQVYVTKPYNYKERNR